MVVVEDRASCGNYSPRFGSWFADTDLDEDGELAPRRHRDVAVAAPRASRGHPSLWYWMIWFVKCTDKFSVPYNSTQQGYVVKYQLSKTASQRTHVRPTATRGWVRGLSS